MNSFKATILVIDDEVQIRRFLKISLESHQYQIIEASTGTRGLEMVVTGRPDLIILDIGLPDMDGLAVLNNLRQWSEIPTIILSAKDEEDTIVTALESGADDYLTKPFAMRELLARIKNCLRKSSAYKAEEIFRSGHLEVNFSTRLVLSKGLECSLTSTEYDLLKILIKYAGKVITHQQLLKEVWGPNSTEHNQYLRVYIGHLRQKIEEVPNRPKLIVTESGVGYRLKLLAIPDRNEE